MSTREKYNLISPVMMNIASLVSCHETEQLKSYLTTMKEIENLVRSGSDIRCTALGESSSEATQESAAGGEASQEPSSYIAVLTNSKFQDVAFRPKLKARGRPKRAIRQLVSFNKINVDRAASTAKKGRKRANGEPTNNKETTSPEKRRLLPKLDAEATFCPMCGSKINLNDDVVETICCL